MSSVGAAHIAFLAALEQAGDLTKPVCAFRMGRCGDDFVERRWLRPAHAYLTRQMVSFLDGEIEVEVEIDLMNFVEVVGGVDRLEEQRNALGL